MRTAIALLLLLSCEKETVSSPPPAPPPKVQPAASPPPPAAAKPDPRAAKPEAPATPFAEAMNRALEASSRNDARAAELAYREALKIQPDDAGALAGLAETLFAQGQHPEAITTIEKAWELAPTNPQVRWTFGIIMLTNKKRTKEAVAAWEALAKENPEYAEPMGVTQRLQEIKKYMEPSPHGAPKAKAPEK